MTLNRYQKLQSDIHLDESRKEAMVKALLEKDLRPVRRRFPLRAVIPVMAVLLAVFFLYPGRYGSTGGGTASGSAQFNGADAAEIAVEAYPAAEEPGETAVNTVTAGGGTADSENEDQRVYESEEIVIVIDEIEVRCSTDYTRACFVYEGKEYEIFREEKDTEDQTDWIQEYLNELRGKEHE